MVVTRGAIRIGRRARVVRLVAGLGAVRVAVGAGAGISRMGAADPTAAGVGTVAVEPVGARRAVGVGCGAGVRRLAARLGAVGVPIRPRTGVAGVRAADATAAGVGAVAEKAV